MTDGRVYLNPMLLVEAPPKVQSILRESLRSKLDVASVTVLLPESVDVSSSSAS